MHIRKLLLLAVLLCSIKMGIVQAGEEKGILELQVSAKGLKTGKMQMEVK